MAKKWYESGWLWAGVGVGAFILLRGAKAKAEPKPVVSPPPWDPRECSEVPLSDQVYVNKLIGLAGRAFPGQVPGNFCMVIDEFGKSVSVQVGSNVFEMDIDTVKTTSDEGIVKAIRELVS